MYPMVEVRKCLTYTFVLDEIINHPFAKFTLLNKEKVENSISNRTYLEKKNSLKCRNQVN